MRWWFQGFLVAAASVAAIGCGPKPVHNDEAPNAENVVFPIEYAGAALAWRGDSHRVVVAFTDELNQSEDGVDKWTVSAYCQRRGAARPATTVHLVWSGETKDGKPEGPEPLGARNEDPFGAAGCTGGTTKAIRADASDLDLSTLPVTKALKGSVLVEYLTDAPDAETAVTVVVKTPTADGEARFTRKLPNGIATKTVADSANVDIPEDSLVDVPTPALNNLTLQAQFSQAEGNPERIRMNFLGMVEPATGETLTLVANQTLFLADGEGRLQKGIKITANEGNSLPVDLVFAIDNSGSMGEEHDRVAAKISDFAASLSQSGLDVRFAVVGFNGGITGAVDFTDAGGIKSFLDRDKGVNRSGGFEGPNAGQLEDKAGSFDL